MVYNGRKVNIEQYLSSEEPVLQKRWSFTRVVRSHKRDTIVNARRPTHTKSLFGDSPDNSSTFAGGDKGYFSAIGNSKKNRLKGNAITLKTTENNTGFIDPLWSRGRGPNEFTVAVAECFSDDHNVYERANVDST